MDMDRKDGMKENLKFETVVGLEVHVELKTKSKIFCSCPTEFGGSANAHICEVCAGLPGALPRFNRQVLDYAVMTALALNCEVTERSRFDRKNYFYPDLPKGYQISQLYAPIGRNGYLDTPEGRVRIHEIHMEDDAGKLVHDAKKNATFVDYSRCGVPLLEIVTEPDFRGSEEVISFLETLRTLLKALGVSDCKMQEGSLRADVNLSVRAAGDEALGNRTEMKNLASFRAVSKAIVYESRRQWEILQKGGMIERETRRWDEEKEQSFAMRKKEDAAEYKYFPEPDIPEIWVTQEKIDEIRSILPELPQQKFRRYITQMHLPEYDAGILSANKETAELFEKTAQICGDPKEASNWIMVELMKLMNDHGVLPEELKIRDESLGEIIAMVQKGQISRASGKEVLRAAFEDGVIPAQYAQEKDMWILRDPDTLRKTVEDVLEENPKAVGEYLAGKTKNFQFLLGQAMRMTRGKADPEVLKQTLQKALSEMDGQ